MIGALPLTAAARFGRGLGSIAFSQAVAAAHAIVLVPLFLRNWGPDLYGRWLSLTALIFYVTLLDFGGQNFIGNLLASSWSRRDEREFRQTLAQGLSLFALLAAVGFAVLLAILALPSIHVVHRAVPVTPQDRLVLLLMGSVFLLGIPQGIWVTVYRATGLLARGAVLGNLIRSVALVGYALLLLGGAGLVTYAACNTATAVITALVGWWDVRRCVPASRVTGLGLAAARAALAHLKGSAYFWLLAVAAAVNQQAVIVVLALSGSRTAVTLYATHRTASGLIGYIGNLVNYPLWPELTFLHAQGRKEMLRRTAMLAVKIVGFSGAAAAVALAALLPWIYPLWTGRKLSFDPALLALFLLQAVLASGWMTSGWTLLASNQHRRLARWSLVNALINVSGCLLLARLYGVWGAATAALFADILCGVAVYPRLACRQLGVSASEMYRAVLAPLIIVLPVAAFPLLAQWHGSPRARLLTLGLVEVALLYLVARLTLGSKEDVRWLAGKVREMRKA